MKQKLIFTNIPGETIDGIVAELGNPPVAVIADTNTARLVLPLLQDTSEAIANGTLITVSAGDANKNLDQAAHIWRSLSDMEATRHTVAINLGGGMVSDIGGFAAATFKRGIRCINVPTTLLAAVDASVGGKTGINFNGYKNQIGTFTEAEASVISTIFFDTLPQSEILSGYAEMLKHGLLESPEMTAKLLAFNPVNPTFDAEGLMPLLQDSVMVKADIADKDLTETGLRRALNLGHTVGHAIESFALSQCRPVPHGYAVAWGLVTELILSHLQLGFPSDTLHTLATYVQENYGAFPLTCDDYPALLAAMRQDKKNISPDTINFTLLKAPGEPRTDSTASAEQIAAALDIYRDLMHLA